MVVLMGVQWVALMVFSGWRSYVGVQRMAFMIVQWVALRDVQWMAFMGVQWVAIMGV